MADILQVKLVCDTGEMISNIQKAAGDFVSNMDTMKNAVNNTGQATKAAGDAIGSGMGKATGEAADASKKLGDDAKRAGDEVKKFGDEVGKAGEKAKGASGGIVNITEKLQSLKTIASGIGMTLAGAFAGAIGKAISYEKSLMGVMRVTGMSAEEVSKFAYACKQTGMDIEAVSTSMRAFSRNVMETAQNSTDAELAMNKYGIQVKDSNDKLLPTANILEQVANKFKSMPDGIEKTNLAVTLFGRGGMDLIKIMNAGGAGLAKFYKEAEQMGFVLKDLSAVKAYIQATRQFGIALDGIQMQMFTAVAPAITALANVILLAVKAFNSIPAPIKTTVINIALFSTVILSVVGGFRIFVVLLNSLGGVFAMLGARVAMLPNVFSLVGTACVTMGSITVNTVRIMATAFITAINPVNMYRAAMVVCNAVMVAGRVAYAGMVSALTAVRVAFALAQATTVSFAAAVAISTVVSNATKSLSGLTTALSSLPAILTKGITGFIAWASAALTGATATAIFEAVVTGGLAIVGAAVLALLAICGGFWIAYINNWGGIADSTGAYVDAISNAMMQLWQNIKSIGSNILNILKSIGKAMLQPFNVDNTIAMNAEISNSFAAIGTAATGAGSAISAAFSNAKAIAVDVGSKIWDFVMPEMPKTSNIETPAIHDKSSDEGKKGKEEKGASGGGAEAYQAFERELEMMKDAQDAFHEMSKKDEISFWASKLAIIGKGTEEEYKIIHKIRTLQKEEQKKQYDDEMDVLKARLNDERTNGYEKAAIIKEISDKVRSAYGEESDEYRKYKQEEVSTALSAAKDIVKIERDKVSQIADDMRSNLGIEEEIISQRRILGEIGALQELKQKQDIENARYEILLAEAKKELDLIRSQGLQKTQVEIEALKKIEDLHREHNVSIAKQQTAAIQAVKEEYNSFGSGIESSFASGFKGIINGTKSIGDAFSDVCASILDSWADMIAKQVWQTAVGNQQIKAIQEGAGALKTASTVDTSAIANASTQQAAITNIVQQGVMQRSIIESNGAVASGIAGRQNLLEYEMSEHEKTAIAQLGYQKRFLTEQQYSLRERMLNGQKLMQFKLGESQILAVKSQKKMQELMITTNANAMETASNEAKNATDIAGTTLTANAKTTAIQTAGIQAAAANQAATTGIVASCQTAIASMMAMLPMLLLFAGIASLFGGGGGGGGGTTVTESSRKVGESTNGNRGSQDTPMGSYEVGSWEIKKDETAKIHAGEMVVPKEQAEGVRKSFLNFGHLKNILGSPKNNEDDKQKDYKGDTSLGAQLSKMMQGLGVVRTAFAGMPSFDVGSWSIPQDTVAQVHKGEMIVPAKGGQADSMRQALSGKGANLAGASNATTADDARQNVIAPNININANAIDGQGMDRVLNKYGKIINSIVHRAVRNNQV